MNIPIHCVYERIVPIEELQPHPKNPNKHPAEQIRLLAKIIQHTGWRGCIVVSNRSGLMVEGHARLEAARTLGLPAVPVDFQDFESEAEELAHLIADNQIAEFSGIHDGQLKSLVKELEAANLDLELAGILAETEQAAPPQAEYPIAPKLQEHYDYLVIFTENEMDFAFLQELFALERVQSYKKMGVGLGRAIPFKKFYDSIIANRNTFSRSGAESANGETPAAS